MKPTVDEIRVTVRDTKHIMEDGAYFVVVNCVCVHTFDYFSTPWNEFEEALHAVLESKSIAFKRITFGQTLIGDLTRDLAFGFSVVCAPEQAIQALLSIPKVTQNWH